MKRCLAILYVWLLAVGAFAPYGPQSPSGAVAQTFSGTLSGGAALKSSGAIFSNGFEQGNFSAWDYAGSYRNTVQGTVVHSGSYAEKIDFLMCAVENAPDAVTGTIPGGSLGARTYHVKITYFTNNAYNGGTNGQTLPSASEVTQAVAANNLLTVTSPASQIGLTGWNVYVTTTSGDYSTAKQNASPVAFGTAWIEPTGGLISGAAIPTTNSACGGAHQDDNNGVQKWFNSGNGYPNGLNHFFVRGYFRFHKNSAGTCDGCQRKLFYLKAPIKSGGTHNYGWAVVLTTTVGARTFKLVHDGADCGAPNPGIAPVSSYDFDTWYHVEVEVLPNSAPSTTDGAVRLWVDGVKVDDQTNINITGTCNAYAPIDSDGNGGINRVEAGTQVDRLNYSLVDESRYVDDVVISSSYIGP